MSDLSTGAQLGTAAVGALGGGAGVVWLAKLLLGRMIAQYDKRHDEHARRLESTGDELTTKLERVTERLGEALTRVAVLEAVLEDARKLRVEVERAVARLRGEGEARHAAAVGELEDLRADVYVAHRRLELLAGGDSEIEKVQKPQRVSKRR